MKRRTFLQALGALFSGGVALPALPKPSIASRAILRAPSGMVWADSGLKTRALAESLRETKERVITSNFQRALWPGVNKWFEAEYKNIPDEMSKL